MAGEQPFSNRFDALRPDRNPEQNIKSKTRRPRRRRAGPTTSKDAAPSYSPFPTTPLCNSRSYYTPPSTGPSFHTGEKLYSELVFSPQSQSHYDGSWAAGSGGFHLPLPFDERSIPLWSEGLYTSADLGRKRDLSQDLPPGTVALADVENPFSSIPHPGFGEQYDVWGFDRAPLTDPSSDVVFPPIPAPGPENLDPRLGVVSPAIPLASSNVDDDTGWTTVKSSKRSRRNPWIENGYACDTCPKKFNRECDLTTHKKRHSPKTEREHKCLEPNCNKSFYYPKDLEKHMHSHYPAGRPLYRCEICSKEYLRKDNLGRHLKDAHQDMVVIQSRRPRKRLSGVRTVATAIELNGWQAHTVCVHLS
ncbi:hypothetical protein P152DRAFT_310428 [Eremomyces bilateralis CBS 781.70]|uniref:C2H2-type domain-containing protein n=1 Tax=Eremomyces bilateralis CBS 781.70 TaxID=1392243 RepID=A0A6G1G592_9PEZI|nr:uncharacterized protein P152DRAFT_310428 [Eremomyces bilateralis CBS 781.70]KAF1813224.1 hypothetical protein P152DRAFT_310428 [Eremomyces bilateralis CBS 781.70]